MQPLFGTIAKMTTLASMELPDTSALVARALKNDQDAWNEIVDQYTRLVWHVVRGFHQLGPQAQADAHQTTWLKLAEQLINVRDPQRLGAWLATTARRECYRLLKAAEREIPQHEIDIEPSSVELDQHMLESERDAHLWQAFGELGEACQALLRLLLVDPPLSYDEVSEMLDMKRGSIGPTRRRCLDLLKAKLNEASRQDRS